MSKGKTRAGFVAIIGAPNAGKSTLLNRLVGTKLAIVTHKVQTTRMRLRGIRIEGKSQLIFVDTPGIFAPKRRLDRAMVAAAWSGATDADITLLLIDAKRGLTDEVEKILEGLAERGEKAVLALNKVDLVERRETLLALAANANDAAPFERTFMISAATGDGVDDLLAYLAGAVPAGPWLFGEDELTDISQRLMAAELTREKIYLQLHQELPYMIAVETEEWNRRKDGSIDVSQVIYVERDSQKGIVIGKRGARLKAIGSEARAEMESAFDARIHLHLFVKVDPNWQDKRERYSDLGLDWVE